MVRKKVLISGCIIALIGFMSIMLLPRIITINNSNGAIIAIGGLITDVGCWLMLFLGIWLYKTKRIKNKLG